MASALRAALSRNIRVLASQAVTQQFKVAVGQTPWNLKMPAGQTIAVSGWSWSPLRSMSSCRHTDSIEEQITSIALDVIQSNPHNKSVYDAIDFVKDHPKIDPSPNVFRHQVILKVIEFMEKDPEVDRFEVFAYTIGSRGYVTDGTEDLSRDDVISRVLYLVKRHPKVCLFKVTQESHFSKDLGMNMRDRDLLRIGFVMEFKLWISEEMMPKLESVKSAIDYIFDHRDERMIRKELFKMMVYDDPRSGPPPSAHVLKNTLW